MLASAFSLKTTQLVNIPNDLLSNISLPDFSKFFSTAEIWKDGITIGLLATLETSAYVLKRLINWTGAIALRLLTVSLLHKELAI